MSTISIIVGADIVPTQSNEDLFINGDVNILIGKELKSLLNNCNFRIFNLEVPLTDKKTPITKCGPNLIASKGIINGIKAINPSLLTLANNHIMDQDTQGLLSTISLLENSKIDYI